MLRQRWFGFDADDRRNGRDLEAPPGVAEVLLHRRNIEAAGDLFRDPEQGDRIGVGDWHLASFRCYAAIRSLSRDSAAKLEWPLRLNRAFVFWSGICALR